ncbi:unnamed protein product [Nezara viridula]|uniref:Uncharacterized protein n=1 Tax=Nezara viridula TaxID=85310 RepID=A0A9P0HKN6_NEZVI|nr:unnamed protein product [Nezara viridula]
MRTEEITERPPFSTSKDTTPPTPPLYASPILKAPPPNAHELTPNPTTALLNPPPPPPLQPKNRSSPSRPESEGRRPTTYATKSPPTTQIEPTQTREILPCHPNPHHPRNPVSSIKLKSPDQVQFKIQSQHFVLT